MKKLNEIVKEMLDNHGGGQTFFDNLDAEIRENNDLIRVFLDEYVYEYIDTSEDYPDTIIVSGRFGRALQQYGLEEELRRELHIRLIVVNGGLRKGEPIDDFKEFVNNYHMSMCHGNYIFIDDSFYSGKTRDVVKDKIESYNGTLLHTIVLYDGSIKKDDNVTSMYRYYDNHGLKEE